MGKSEDYWRKWAEHNRNFWNNPHAHHYARRFGRGRMVGKFVIFVLGFGAGAFVGNRYQLGPPKERWEEIKAAADNIRKDHPDSPELREILDRVKELEKRYRRAPPSDDHPPPPSDAPSSKPSE